MIPCSIISKIAIKNNKINYGSELIKRCRAHCTRAQLQVNPTRRWTAEIDAIRYMYMEASSRESDAAASSDELCCAEEQSDAQLLPRREVLGILERLVLELLTSVREGKDPQLIMVIHTESELTHRHINTHTLPLSLLQVSRTEKNVVRDTEGHVHLGRGRTVKHLFGNKASGTHRFAKS